MNNIETALRTVWTFKLQPLPILISLGIYYLPTYYRKFKHFYYTPIYFTVFPFKSLNPLLSQYWSTYNEFPDLQGSQLIMRLKKTAFISTLIDGFIVPLSTGIFCSFYVDKYLLMQFLYVLFSIRLFQLLQSWIQLFNWLEKKSAVLLCLIYCMYLWVMVNSINYGYTWATTILNKDGLRGLLSEANKIFYLLIIAVFLLPTVSTFFAESLTKVEPDEGDSSL